MKTRISAIIIIAALYFSACHKEASVNPFIATTQGTQQLPSTSIVLNQDTAGKKADSTSGYICVKLAKDTINTDGLMISFNPKSTAAYSGAEDARFMQGFGMVSFSSLSSDNVPLSINTLPLLSRGTTVKLVVNATKMGLYKLYITKIQAIPANYDIWLMDKFKKDSLDFRHNPSYLFDMTADTNSYGSNRFTMVTRLHH
ncbi:hypothetical protein [Mucilaginibacter sp.]|uniref:hypothetical protein n=1 Tax=Mucilaginibacter sp. TaxID=1882438 RepID=UPI0028514F26|nr:hypothetical protein [Mucilaginibacter sp.]MDR3693901.1 hypothetical protein [Mucilaginibacter sp.]